MSDELVLKLSLAMQHIHHANFAGTPRQAIADSYSGVDAIFSALLLQDGEKPPTNHKAKLNLCRTKYPNAFDARRVRANKSLGADWNSLEDFYAEWLSSRYEQFTIRNDHAASRGPRSR